jgi:hypothetical protein
MIVMTGLHGGAPLPTQAFFQKPFDTGALLAAVARLHAVQPEATRP